MPRPALNVSKTQINLFTTDKDTMIKRYGPGWTEQVRELVKNHCVMLRNSTRVLPQQFTEYDDD